MVDKKRCFVIMPISETKNHTEAYWNRHFCSFLKPIIEEDGVFEASRSEAMRVNIANQIITDLITSDVVVADITDYNPNVLWELGVRHSFTNGTIIIAEDGTKPPFEFSQAGFLFYNGDHLDYEDFKNKFLNLLKDCLEQPNKIDSPVLEALGSRGSLYSIMNAEANKRRIDALKFEVELNNHFIRRIYSLCSKNKDLRKKGKPDETEMEISPLKTSTMNLLFTNRYLDNIDDESYELISNYSHWMSNLNQRLSTWEEHPIHCEDWLWEYKTNIKKINDKMNEFVESL